MRNISKDLKQRLAELDRDIDLAKNQLAILTNRRDGLQLELEAEENRWKMQGDATAKIKSNLATSVPARVSDVIYDCLDSIGKTKDTLKQELKAKGIDGRKIHTALYSLSKRGLVEQVDGLWKRKRSGVE